MPLPLAPFLAFAIGVLLAWHSRTETNHEESFWNPQTQAVLLYGLLVFAPVAGYFATFAADWSFAYLVDARHVPSALSLLIVGASVASVVGGFIAGRRALERHAPAELAWLAGCPLALVLIALGATYDRLSVAATYDQFASNFGRESLVASRLGLAVVWMDGIVAAGAIFTARWLVPQRAPGQTPPPPVQSVPVAPVNHDDAPKRFLGHRKTPR